MEAKHLQNFLNNPRILNVIVITITSKIKLNRRSKNSKLTPGLYNDFHIFH